MDIIPQNIRDYSRIVVAGNVDSGKSTIVGVLTRGTLDDGNGSARKVNIYIILFSKRRFSILVWNKRQEERLVYLIKLLAMIKTLIKLFHNMNTKRKISIGEKQLLVAQKQSHFLIYADMKNSSKPLFLGQFRILLITQ